MDYTAKLSDEGVLEYAREVLAEHVPLAAEGYVCTGADLLIFTQNFCSEVIEQKGERHR